MRQVRSKDQGHGCHGLTQISDFANPNIPRRPLTDRHNPPSLLLSSLLQQHGAGPTSSRSHALLSPAPGLLQLPCGDGRRAASPELAVGLEQRSCSGPCQPQPQLWASCGGGDEGEQSLAAGQRKANAHGEGSPELLCELLALQISGSVRAASGPAAAKPTHKAKANRQQLLLSLLTRGWRYQLKSAAGRFSSNKRPRLPRHPVIEMQNSAAGSRGSRDKVTQEKQIHRGALRGQRCHLGLARTAGRLPGAPAAPTPLLSPCLAPLPTSLLSIPALCPQPQQERSRQAELWFHTRLVLSPYSIPRSLLLTAESQLEPFPWHLSTFFAQTNVQTTALGPTREPPVPAVKGAMALTVLPL